MQLGGGLILDKVKLKIINTLLDGLRILMLKLLYFQAKYKSTEEIEQTTKQQKFDMRGMTNRFKNVLLHDQDIIDKRLEICNDCEFLFKPTGTCKKCGCFVSKKTRVATVACPVDKWGKEYNFIKGEATSGTHPIN